MDPPRLAEAPNVPIRTLVREISIIIYANNHVSNENDIAKTVNTMVIMPDSNCGL